MIEKEVKCLLSQAEYLELQAFCQNEHLPCQSYSQTNYYYDTDDFDLYQKGDTLRVREKENSVPVMEYKELIKNDGAVRECKEYKKQIHTLPKQIALSEVFENPAVDSQIYKYLGALTTERTDYYLKGCTISLDKNIYLGMVDYEIEAEFDKEADLKYLERLGFSIDFSESISKYRRFITGIRSTGH